MRLAALWIPKAAEWRKGRKNLFQELESQLQPGDKTIWMHCASAGEFEQGKSVLQALKAAYPKYKIVISFFSPSGFGVGRKFKAADIITYLPLDTAVNAARFVESVRPELVVFVKYDYWYHHLKAVSDRRLPLLLISAIYRDNQVFFKWYGGLYRKLLQLFSWIFVQDEDSVKRLHSIGVKHCSVSGDTRFDRVATIVKEAAEIPHINQFINQTPTIVAGSTWQEDEQLFSALNLNLPYKLIIAPHEISSKNVERLLEAFPNQAVPYSELQYVIDAKAYQVLIIDNIGMLSRLYRYASITYIGGGFNKSGIHNTLEAAAWGKTVIFGPNYQKFREAKGLLKEEAAFSITTSAELQTILSKLLENQQLTQQAGEKAAKYVAANGGATATILAYIQENRLLTNS